MEDKSGVILCKWIDSLLHQGHDELLSPGYNTVLKTKDLMFSKLALKLNYHEGQPTDEDHHHAKEVSQKC